MNLESPPKLPSQQQAIYERCFHPAGTFVEFEREEIEQSIPAKFEQQVRRFPERLAIKSGAQELTYDELNQAANRVAQAVLARGGREQQPVALLFEHGPSAIIGLLGVLKAGKICVPLDPMYPSARLASQLKDSQVILTVTNNRNLSLAEELAQSGRQWINVDEIDTGPSVENPELPLSPDSLAYILFTSGSTGRAKGVVQNHRIPIHRAMQHTNSYHICMEDRIGHLWSYSSGSSVREIFAALLNGATLNPFSLKEKGVDQLANWLIEEGITICYTGPPVFRHFVGTLSGEEEFPQLRLIILSGDPLYRTDLALYREHFSPDCLLVHKMGCREAGTVGHYFIDHESRISEDIVPVGYPIQDVEVSLLDDEGNEVGFECVGEIVVRGRYLPLGYWQRGDLTETTYLTDPDGGDKRICRTGDLGFMQPDGCLVHMGRKDTQVKIRGYRVDVGEIEQSLLGLDNIKEAAVATWNDQSGNLRLVAYVVPSAKPAPTVSALRRQLTEKQPDYMVPSTFVFLEALPISQMGKLDRRALPVPEWTRPELETAFVAPRTPVEKGLAEICAEVLGIDQVGMHDDFFALGGNSLLAMRLVALIEKTFEQTIPLVAVFEIRTVEELAEIIRLRESPKRASTLWPIQPDGSRPPFFCVPGGEGNILEYRELALCLGGEQPFYGLQPPGVDGTQSPLDRIEDMASYYISEIRALQPEGPYFLGGECFGGMVAFEMARNLTGQGQKVNLLALIDTPAPPSAMSKAALFFKAPKYLHSPLMRRLGMHLLNLMSVGFREKLSYIQQCFRNLMGRRKWEKDSRVEVESQDERPEAIQNLRGASSQAFRSYVPQDYPGKITLFRADHYRPRRRLIKRNFLPACLDRRLVWAKWAGDGLELKRIPGDHRTMLRKPHVQVLADQLKSCLLEAQKEESK